MILTTESIVTDKKGRKKECSCGHNEPAGMEGMY